MSIAYAALPPDQLRRTRLEWMEAVYHRSSAITHILAEPLPALLDVIEQMPRPAYDILTALERDYDLVPTEEPQHGDALAIVTARLEELATLGLIRKIATPDAQPDKP